MSINTVLWDCTELYTLSAKIPVSAIIKDETARRWIREALYNLMEIDAAIREYDAIKAAKCGNPADIETPTLAICHGCSNLDGAPDGLKCIVHGRAVELSIKNTVFSECLDRVKINPLLEIPGNSHGGPVL